MPADPFDFDEANRDARRRPRDPGPRGGHGSSAFWTTFGGSLGCVFALVVVVVVGVILGELRRH